MIPCILYFFIHPQPNNIGIARQQPREWGSLLLSLSLVGAQLLLISFATTRLHGICNGSVDGMEDGGGGGHTLQFHSLGTGDPRGGGGGSLIFSTYVGSDPASTVHPKKYQEFQAPQKNI